MTPFGLKNAGATYQHLVNSLFAPLIGNTMEALKGSKRSTTWTAEGDKAFSELKEYMSRAPLLSTPEPGDILMIYLSISPTAVNSVLIWPKKSAEHPVHYVSKALQDAEVRYPDIEKLAFALVVSARRLRPHFQAHTIHVLTNQPLKQVLQKPETSGRLVKWAIELGEFDIHFWEASNGQVEAVNKIIKKTLKTKLDKAKGCWPELLPEVLWSYRTTFHTSKRETPFSLSFGTEVVAPVEIDQPIYRTSTYDAEANDEQLALNLDFIAKLCDQSNLRNVAYKQRIAKYYDSRVKPRAFKIGVWVMRKVSLAIKNPTESTLGPTWEGPYEITKVCCPGTYQLQDPKGKTLPHPWNADHLKYYYK
ncbi:unnamed protein product [Prunus brigantina]